MDPPFSAIAEALPQVEPELPAVGAERNTQLGVPAGPAGVLPEPVEVGR
jgi:hypothetical protein